jgi:hypothetical protein
MRVRGEEGKVADDREVVSSNCALRQHFDSCCEESNAGDQLLVTETERNAVEAL